MKTSILVLAAMSVLGTMFGTSCGPSANKPSKVPANSEQWVTASSASTQIHQLTEMNAKQLRELPRERTVVVIAGSYIGQHGPYLPCVDCFRNERLARELAHAIAQSPGWHVLAFPFIPLGQGSFEELGAKPGLHHVFTVLSGNLRSVFMDFADRIGEFGFRWVFVINSHGSPYHLRALDQAGDYFHDTYHGHMIHLTGLLGLDDLTSAAHSTLNETERDEDGLGFHAGMRETSEALFLRPDLVNPAYKQASPVTVRNDADITEVSRREDWPGYIGSPRLGKASVGEAVLKEYSARLNKLALEILDGRDYRQMPRLADEALKGLPDVPEHERALAEKQEGWMKRKQSPKGPTR